MNTTTGKYLNLRDAIDQGSILQSSISAVNVSDKFSAFKFWGEFPPKNKISKLITDIMK
jgi:hypothetical protein